MLGTICKSKLLRDAVLLGFKGLLELSLNSLNGGEYAYRMWC